MAQRSAPKREAKKKWGRKEKTNALGWNAHAHGTRWYWKTERQCLRPIAARPRHLHDFPDRCMCPFRFHSLSVFDKWPWLNWSKWEKFQRTIDRCLVGGGQRSIYFVLVNSFQRSIKRQANESKNKTKLSFVFLLLLLEMKTGDELLEQMLEGLSLYW